jgi:hypothetical protein
MRARPILNLILGLFVVAAVAMVGWQARSGRAVVPSPAPPSPRAEASVAARRADPADAAGGVVAPKQSAAEAVVELPVRAAPAAPIDSAAAAVPPKPATRKVAVKKLEPAPPVRRIVAMYFHGDVRCVTCRKVEAYAKEAVETGFAEQLAAGVVEFRAVNVDREENRHFIQDYQLTNKSVVVADEVDGSVKRWVKLDNVWALVGNHDAYLVYVQDAVRAYVEN